MAASDLGGDGLCVWTAAGGDAAGVDTSLRAARAALAWRSAGQALAGQRADAGPAVGAVAGPGSGPFADAAWDVAAAADSDSWERVGGRQGGLAGGGYGGTVRRERGGRVCVDGGWGGLRNGVGRSAGHVGTGPGRDAGGVAGCGSQSALCVAVGASLRSLPDSSMGPLEVIKVERFSYRRRMISRRISPALGGKVLRPMSSMINRSALR